MPGRWISRKQQAAIDAAVRRAQQEAQERHRRLEAERLRAEYEAAMDRPPELDDYWTTGEIRCNLYVLQWCSEFFARNYGTPETCN